MKNWNQAAWAQHKYKSPEKPREMRTVGERPTPVHRHHCKRCRGYHVCSCGAAKYDEVREMIRVVGLDMIINKFMGSNYLCSIEPEINDPNTVRVLVRNGSAVGTARVDVEWTSGMADPQDLVRAAWHHAFRTCVLRRDWDGIAYSEAEILPSGFAKVEYDKDKGLVHLIRTWLAPNVRTLLRTVSLTDLVAAEICSIGSARIMLYNEWQKMGYPEPLPVPTPISFSLPSPTGYFVSTPATPPTGAVHEMLRCGTKAPE